MTADTEGDMEQTEPTATADPTALRLCRGSRTEGGWTLVQEVRRVPAVVFKVHEACGEVRVDLRDVPASDVVGCECGLPVFLAGLVR
jgi:hypothetical protein